MQLALQILALISIIAIGAFIFLIIIEKLGMREKKIYEGRVYAKDCPCCEGDMYEVMTNKKVRYYCPSCGWELIYEADEDGFWRIM